LYSWHNTQYKNKESHHFEIVKSFGTLNVTRSASHSFCARVEDRRCLLPAVCTDHFFSCLRSRRLGQYDMRSCGTTTKQRLSMWNTSSFPRNEVALQLPGDFSRRRENAIGHLVGGTWIEWRTRQTSAYSPADAPVVALSPRSMAPHTSRSITIPWRHAPRQLTRYDTRPLLWRFRKRGNRRLIIALSDKFIVIIKVIK